MSEATSGAEIHLTAPAYRCAHAGYNLVDRWYWDSHEGTFSLRGLEIDMDQKVEIERMEAAFKRAADKAMRGTREERAGRFAIPNQKASATRRSVPAKHPSSGELKK